MLNGKLSQWIGIALLITALAGLAAAEESPSENDPCNRPPEELPTPLMITKPSETEQTAIDEATLRALEDEKLRIELTETMLARLAANDAKEPNARLSGQRELIALRRLEALDALMQRWNARPSRLNENYNAYSDGRIFHLNALLDVMPPGDRVPFMLRTCQDQTEVQRVRFHALLELCASGDPEAITSVAAIWESDQHRYHAGLRHTAATPRTLRPSEWDSDGDGLTDYSEQGLLLDEQNPDSDGDGLPDGDDRNPRTHAAVNPLTESQKATRVLFWAHAQRQNDPMEGHSMLYRTRPWVYLLVNNTKFFDSSDRPSITADLELIGFNGIALSVSPDEVKHYRALHGDQGASSVLIVCISDLEDDRIRDLFSRDIQVQEGEKLFHLSESGYGYASYLVRMRRYGDIWLPVEWRLHAIS